MSHELPGRRRLSIESLHHGVDGVGVFVDDVVGRRFLGNVGTRFLDDVFPHSFERRIGTGKVFDEKRVRRLGLVALILVGAPWVGALILVGAPLVGTPTALRDGLFFGFSIFVRDDFPRSFDGNLR